MIASAYRTVLLTLCMTLAPISAFGADLSDFASALESLADLTRATDRARSELEYALEDGRDIGRYDSLWRKAELRLERDRIRVIADIAGVRPSVLEDMRRDGKSWQSIARRYDIDPRAFGWGLSRYDTDRDLWKGVPPGLAKKGGLPPGQAKKHDPFPWPNKEMDRKMDRDMDREPHKNMGKNKDKDRGNEGRGPGHSGKMPKD